MVFDRNWLYSLGELEMDISVFFVIWVPVVSVPLSLMLCSEDLSVPEDKKFTG